ncbi:hypothetical protein NBRC116583_10790 [Arenicella sp. 4NH20-0111]|uniref:hypothetical protein n=1 Tax=Arenicella sp. 4NH20-0111 TaxID=3127648 RepID=UPI003102A020
MKLKTSNAFHRGKGTLFSVILIFLIGLSANAIAVTIDSVAGYVTVTTSEGEVKRLNEGDKLNDGDVINTGNESSVSFTLADGTLVSLRSLESYSYQAGDNSTDDGSMVTSGSLNSKKSSLSTATSAGGTVGTTPSDGGSPSN